MLEKDGDIHYFTYDTAQEKVDAKKWETAFSYRNDTEGFCYDPVRNRLLIAPKEQGLDPSGDPEVRGIYAFDLEDKELRPNPVFRVNQKELGEIIYGKPDSYLFKPSAIAVEPKTGNLYLLASVGRILIVLNRENEILHVELLDKKTFRQPEGIAFTESGELLISSEADGRHAILARYSVNLPAEDGTATTPEPTNDN